MTHWGHHYDHLLLPLALLLTPLPVALGLPLGYC
jgi:hypothetical protein